MYLARLSHLQVVTPEQLNSISDDVLFECVDAVLDSFDAGDRAVRPPLASFVTRGILLCVHQRIQELIKRGSCNYTKHVTLALVMMDMTGVRPPADKGDISADVCGGA